MSSMTASKRTWIIAGAALLVAAGASVCVFATDLLGLALVAGFRHEARRQDSSPQQIQRGAPITRPGSYHYSDATQLDVRLEPEGGGHVVFYQLAKNGRVLVAGGGEASGFHRWSFTLDDQDRLWFYSADIGLSVWTPVDGEWRRTVVGDQIELIRAIPPDSSLPVSKSARERWNKLLSQP